MLFLMGALLASGAPEAVVAPSVGPSVVYSSRTSQTDLVPRVKDTIARTLNLDIADVSDTALIRDDLGADDVGFANLIRALESEFHVAIPDRDMERLRTVRDVIGCIERLSN